MNVLQHATALILQLVESTYVGPEVHYDAEAEGEYCSTPPRQYRSAGNSYRQCQTFADGATRESRSRSCQLRIRSSGHRPSSRPDNDVRGFEVTNTAS